MTEEQIIRAWKDEAYRRSLSGEELSALPHHPAGLIELSDESLLNVGGREEVTVICSLNLACALIAASALWCTVVSVVVYSKVTDKC